MKRLRGDVMAGLWFDGRELALRQDLPVPVAASPGECLVQIQLVGSAFERSDRNDS